MLLKSKDLRTHVVRCATLCLSLIAELRAPPEITDFYVAVVVQEKVLWLEFK